MQQIVAQRINNIRSAFSANAHQLSEAVPYRWVLPSAAASLSASRVDSGMVYAWSPEGSGVHTRSANLSASLQHTRDHACLLTGLDRMKGFWDTYLKIYSEIDISRPNAGSNTGIIVIKQNFPWISLRFYSPKNQGEISKSKLHNTVSNSL